MKTEKQTIEDMVLQLQASNDLIDVREKYVEFNTIGQTVAGILLRVNEIPSSKNDKDYFSYTLQTDEGLVSVICGVIIDKVLASGKYINHLVILEFLGSREHVKGKKLNEFNITVSREPVIG